MEGDDFTETINGYLVDFNKLTMEEIKIINLSQPCKGHNNGNNCPEFLRTKQKCCHAHTIKEHKINQKLAEEICIKHKFDK